MNVLDYAEGNKLSIIAKPNSKKTQITGWDSQKKSLKVEVHAPPEKGKANTEIIKFFSGITKKKVEITAGKTSKNKILKFSTSCQK